MDNHDDYVASAVPRMRSIVDESTDPALAFDSDCRVIAANDAVARLFGCLPAQLPGAKLDSILRLTSVASRQVALRVDGTSADVNVDVTEVSHEGTPYFVATLKPVAEHEPDVDSHELSELLASMPVGLSTLDAEGRIEQLNSAALSILAYSEEELLNAKFFRALVASEDQQAYDLHVARVRALGRSTTQLGLVDRNGERIDVRLSSVRRVVDGRFGGSKDLIEDLSRLRRAELSCDELQHRYERLYHRNLAGVYRATTDGGIFDCNDACARVLGFDSRDELLDESRRIDPFFDSAERRRIVDDLRTAGSVSGLELCFRKRDGAPVWVLLNLSLIKASDGEDILEGTLFDITAQKLAEQRVEYHTQYDALTGLPNPSLLHSRIEAAIAQAGSSTRALALLFIDLDHFKSVNDTLAHSVGDELLQLVSYRFQSALRQEDTVARFGGDEFAILLQGIRYPDAAVHVAQKILSALEDPFLLAGQEIFVTASIGIALYPTDGATAEALLRSADAAMFRAKEAGRNCYEFSQGAVSEKSVERLTMENDLRRALHRDELRLFFQPQIDSTTGRIFCVEALLRWNHPRRGLVLPAEFISVAEDLGLILPIGEWVLDRACQQAAFWLGRYPGGLRVAVNLSGRQFQQRDFAATVERILKKHKLPPHLLEVEITESVAMKNPELAVMILETIKSMGVRISIDDFGTGYSSLSYLKRFPIDSLKIDQSFVRDVGSGGSDAAIVSAVIAMAHQLKLSVIAEGVETNEQHAFLRSQACEQMQGFLFSRPVPAHEIDALLMASGYAEC